MAELTVRITELRDHLSAYLRGVREGDSVTVMDRGQPVARLVPIRRTGGELSILKATRDVRSVELPPASWKPIDVDRLLDEVRSDRV